MQSNVGVEEEIGKSLSVPHGIPGPEMDVGECTRDGKRAQIGKGSTVIAVLSQARAEGG